MFEELVVRSYRDAGALARPVVVVVRVGGHHRPVVEVGGQHPGLGQDQVHHGAGLRLPVPLQVFSGLVYLPPGRKVAI